MFTVYMVRDEDWIPGVVDFLTYERPYFCPYKVLGKLIYLEDFEDKELFWESLENFLKDYKSDKERNITLLPDTAHLYDGVRLDFYEVIYGNIKLILLLTDIEFYKLLE